MGWQRFLRRSWWDEERAREIDAHLDLEAAENVAKGMAPDEAAAAAGRKFGNPVLVREEIYLMNSVIWLESAWQDLRHGARLLRRSPGFTSVAVLSLALGIGANTAIFQLLDAVRLRSLPVENPGELAEVRIVGGNGGLGITTGPYAQLTRPIWDHLRDQQKAFSGVFAWSAGQVSVGQGSETRRAKALFVSGDFFRTLGVRPARGRLLLPEDESACPASRAVVSYSYWQNQMAGRELDGSAAFLVGDDRYQVVGVTPPRFFGLAVGETFDVAIPLCQPNVEPRRDIFDIAVVGRLRPGWPMEQASAHLSAVSAGIFETTAITGYDSMGQERYKHFRLAACPAASGVSGLRNAYSQSLWLLLGLTGLVLLIACSNLANLMLARASTREREVAVRLALGASRFRLLRQSFMESGLLAAIGATLGVLLAKTLSRVLVWSLSTENGVVHLSIDTDWRVLAFAGTVAALTCLLFGAAPAIRGTRAQPAAAMNVSGRGLTTGRDRFGVQRAMVVAQVAVSMVLLVGALLFVRSFRNLVEFDPGVREEGIVLAFLGFEASHVPLERLEEHQRQLLEEIQAVPGVVDAGTTTHVPLVGGAWGHGVTVDAVEGGSMFTWVSPTYFRTMGIPLISGRGFDEKDASTSPRVAVVNKKFVQQFLPGANPLGRTLRTHPEPGYPATVYEIVGVIPDTQYNGLRGETPPMSFAPASQFPDPHPWTAVVIRSNVEPAVMTGTVKRYLADKHPEMMTDTLVFQNLIRDGLVGERLMATLSGFFGFLAALLVTVGLYGVVSYIVARRRNEIGIRIALGATHGRVVRMVMGETAWLLGMGIAVGTLLALLGGRAASSLLFGLTPRDPATLAAASALLALVTAGASFLPARRAARLEPMTALRQE